MSNTTELKDRLSELETSLADQVKAQDAAIDAAELKDGVLQISAEIKDEFDKRRGNIAEIKAMAEALRVQLGAKDYLGQPSMESVAAAAAAAGAFPGGDAPKSLGELFTGSDAFKEMNGGRNSLTMRTPFVAEGLSIAQFKAVFTGVSNLSGTLTGRLGSIQRDAMVPLAHRRIRVRDLFPVQTTQSAVIEYFAETGFTNAASPVAQTLDAGTTFQAMPQSMITLAGRQAVVRTIGHWIPVHRTALDDEPQLQGLVDSELLYGIQLIEDAQILAGNPSTNSEDLPGILNTSGIQTYTHGGAASATDNKADDIRRALTKCFLAFYEPTGVVVHPSDWEAMELAKDTTGNYLLAISIAMGGEPKLWNVPVVQTPAISAGTALAGAFGLGAQLYDRMEASVRVAEQHSDFAVRNAVAVIAEERLALAVKRPEAFVKVTF